MNQNAEQIEDFEDDFDDIEVEIVDDRPEEDRKPSALDSIDSDDVSEDELSNYSENVQKRIKKMSWEKNELRRAKEEAERLREEAIQYAKTVYSDNARLKSTLREGETVLVRQAQGRLQAQLDQAKARAKEAYDSGDSDAMIEAQAEVARLQNEKYRVDSYKPAPEQPVQEFQPQVQQQQQQAANAQPQQADLEWAGRNPWFGSNKEMTGFAYGVHDRLVESGVKEGSPLYYQSIDEAVKQRFPEEFGGTEERVSTSQSRQTGNVVAPARRSSRKPRQVTLTPSAAQLANRLGLTPEQYAAQVMKLNKG